MGSSAAVRRVLRPIGSPILGRRLAVMARRGRPPTTGRARTGRVVARLDPDEQATMRDLCERMQMPPSDVLRWAIEYLRRHVDELDG